MFNKKTVFIFIALITVLLFAATISATENTNTTAEKIQKTTNLDKNTETNTKQENTKNKNEIKKVNTENKTAKEASYSVFVDSKTVTEGRNIITATVRNNRNYSDPVNSGTVDFFVNNAYVGSDTPYYGVASINYKFKEGTYKYHVDYYNSGYIAYSGTATITVKTGKYPATISMNADTMLQGTNINYKMIVRNSSNKLINEGKIKFYIDNQYKITKSVNNGVSTVTIGSLSAGTHQLKAEFISDHYQTATQTKTLTVKSNQVNIDINASGRIKTTENFIVKTKIKSLDGEPVGNNGYITLYLNNKYVKKVKVSYAQASFNLGKQKEGTYTIKAIYERPKFVTKTQTKTVTVYDVPEVVKLDVPSSTLSDNTIKVVARVTKDGKRVNDGKLKIVATGNKIYENTNIKQGLGAVFYRTPSTIETYTIVAQYLKNGKVISQDKKSITNTLPNIKLSMPTEGETDKQVKIVARVTNGGKPVYNGQVKIIANGITIYNKQIKDGMGAVFYKTPVKSGTYIITSQYIKNGKVISQDSQTLEIINTESIRCKISGTYYSGDKITLTAYVTKPSGTVNYGKVIFKINGETVGSKDVINGKATMTYTTPTYETNLISTVEYVKNGEVISQDSQTTKTINGENIRYEISGKYNSGEKVTLTAYVTKPSGTVNYGKVRFNINGETLGSKDVINGKATMTYMLPTYETELTSTVEYIKNGKKITSASKNIKVTVPTFSSKAKNKKPYIENPYYYGAQLIVSTEYINGHYYHLGCGGLLYEDGYTDSYYDSSQLTQSLTCIRCGHVFSDYKYDYTAFL